MTRTESARRPARRFAGLAAGLAIAAGLGAAAVTLTAQAPQDPRVGLRPGETDAGVAARHMELVSNLPRPKTFQDPAGPGGLNHANSDLAFRGPLLFLGNFHGFNFYDIEDPRKPQLRVSVECPGGQGDLSIYGNLLFMSVEQTRGRLDCGTQGVTEAVSAERFRGVRIFDVTNVSRPRQIAAIQTCRGSHTHTLIVDPDDKENIYVYGSGTSSVRSAEELAGCSGLGPDEDPNTALFSIDVIQVPLKAPQTAKIVNRPRIFADADTGAIGGLWKGGGHGVGTQTSSVTNQCHDITTFPEIGLAAGACSGNGILLDIRDPVNPKRLDQVSDQNFAYWHSATFNNDGSKVIFTDEWGGGTQPRCRVTDLPTWGANAIFDIVDGKMTFGGYYKLPAPQSDVENCVAHNGSLIPVPGRDVMVQAWYQGGVTVFDFTDAANPFEIAYFDRGPINGEKLLTAGYWSTYWYNGYVYGSEIARGLDIFRLLPSEHLTQNEIDAAALVRLDTFNAQHQPKTTWPASPVVAKAYLDQLERGKALPADRIAAARTALDRNDRGALASLAGQFEAAARTATGATQKRLNALAATLRGIR